MAEKELSRKEKKAKNKAEVADQKNFVEKFIDGVQDSAKVQI